MLGSLRHFRDWNGFGRKLLIRIKKIIMCIIIHKLILFEYILWYIYTILYIIFVLDIRYYIFYYILLLVKQTRIYIY